MTVKMKIIVFAAKEVGLDLSRYILDAFPDDDYTFVVTSPGKDSIVSMLSGRAVQLHDIDDGAVSKILSSGERFDWLLNLWGGYIFDRSLLSLADKTLNIHPSFLPYGRGRDPVVWSIRNGWKAGVSLHEIADEIDAGPIWVREELPYELPIKGGELYKAVVDKCVKTFVKHWPRLRNGTMQPVQQSDGLRTYKRKHLLEDRVIELVPETAPWDVVTTLLAHDFSPDYNAQLRIGGKLYNARLCLEEVADKQSGKKKINE